MIALIMFVVALVLLLAGIPVAFAFGGVAMMFAFVIPDLGFEVFNILSFRIYGIMSNTTLMAVPLFIMMGLILEKSGMIKANIIATPPKANATGIPTKRSTSATTNITKAIIVTSIF